MLGDLYTFKVTGEALSVTELTAFPQNGPPPHIHQREDESLWVLDGEFSVLHRHPGRPATAFAGMK